MLVFTDILRLLASLGSPLVSEDGMEHEQILCLHNILRMSIYYFIIPTQHEIWCYSRKKTLEDILMVIIHLY